MLCSLTLACEPETWCWRRRTCMSGCCCPDCTSEFITTHVFCVFSLCQALTFLFKPPHTLCLQMRKLRSK